MERRSHEAWFGLRDQRTPHFRQLSETGNNLPIRIGRCNDEKELEARNEVKWETYTKKIQIEARVLGDLAMNHIIPVATRYQTDLIDNVYKMKSLFPEEKPPDYLPKSGTYRRDS